MDDVEKDVLAMIGKPANPNRPVCLVDLDGVLIDYDEQLLFDLNLIKSPDEPIINSLHVKLPDYVVRRMDLIRQSSLWWRNLRQRSSGMEILRMVYSIGFRPVICTKGPKYNSDAWKGKVDWCIDNLHPLPDMDITRDKSLTYGRVLVDDYPEFATEWLVHRPRGLVIMPTHDYNKDFKHPQVVHYNGAEDYDAVWGALRRAFERKDREPM